jgi:hypothetical protein
VYDVNASLPQRGQAPLDAFLAGKHGFCEQYATAMAVLLRVMGMPSRVAVGFTPGQAVPGRRGTYSVTTSDAHAWPEAWFPGSGWVRFEPTPAATGATTPGYTLPVTPGGGPSSTPSSGPTPNPSNSKFPQGFKDPDTLLGKTGAGSGSQAATSHHVLRWVLGGLAVVLLLVTPWSVTALRRRNRLRRLDPLVAWEQVRDDVTDVGGPWRTTDSPRAAAARLRRLLDPAGHEAMTRLSTAAELVRYAPPGRASGTGLLEDLTAVRRSLHASAPRGVRWRALLLAPSTLRWMNHALAERVADLLDLSDRLLSLLFRPARRVLRLRT